MHVQHIRDHDQNELLLMQIDHDPKEFSKPNFEAWDRKKANFEKEYGRTVTPGDLFRYIAPIFAVALAMFFWREGWPF